LWRKHQHAPFPARLRDEQVAGVDLVALDAGIARCVDGWRSGDGHLDEAGRTELGRRLDELDAVRPLLTSRAESLYFERLRQVATVLLDA
jgi:hypothetical protein